MENYSEKLLKKARRFSWIFKLCPSIREVSVVNSVAHGTATHKSDIDLFIVTDRNKVLETRCMLAFITQLLGLRVHGKKEAGRFCLSFLVDIENENLMAVKYQKDHFLDDFLKTKITIYKRSSTFTILNIFGRCIAFLVPQLLMSYFTRREIERAKKGSFKNPSVIISPSVFKFHENDSRRL